MSGDGEEEGSSSSSSSQSSSSSFKLPSRQSYFTTLSIIAFASGLGIATVVTIRRGRKMKTEELQRTSLSSINSPSNYSQLTQTKLYDESPLGKASSKGILALFGEMNRSIFKGQSLNDAEDNSSLPSPSALMKRGHCNNPTGLPKGKSVQQSVFDANSTSPPPSVLMRSKPKLDVQSDVQQEKIQPRTTIGDMNSELKLSMGESPVGMAIKAIVIATGIVGIATWVSIEIACRVLKVKNMDELIEKLTSIVPASEKNNEVFNKIGRSARQSLQGTIGSHDEIKDIDTANAYSDSRLRTDQSDTTENMPLPVGEAMRQLDEAIERGDAAAWMDVLSKQLNAERRKELEERQSRMAAHS